MYWIFFLSETYKLRTIFLTSLRSFLFFFFFNWNVGRGSWAVVREGQASRQVLTVHLSEGQEGTLWTEKSSTHSPFTFGIGHHPPMPPGQPLKSHPALKRIQMLLPPQSPPSLALLNPQGKNTSYVLVWVFNVIFFPLLNVRLTVACVSLLRVPAIQSPARNPQLSWLDLARSSDVGLPVFVLF